MLNQYSDKVRELFEYRNDRLLIPDLILEKEGIACGDKLIISGEIDDEILLFDFNYSKSCELSKAVCNYLIKNYNDKKYEYVFNEITVLNDKIEKDKSFIFDMLDIDMNIYLHRFDCIFSPIKLMLTFLREIKNTEYKFTAKPDTHYNMECDACIGACRINWENKRIEKIDHHKNKIYTEQYLEKWLPLGKIILNDKDKRQLKEVCKNMTAEDHQFLSDHTMNNFVLQHLIENYPELLDEKWKVAAYLIQKNEITNKKFEMIKKYILDNQLNIYFVKGYVSQKYYDNPYLRIHSDYDLIANNSEDAFELTNYLLKNGFTIRPNLFSLKNMNYQGKDVVTGHFHVQKILDDMYMFELDITFPGFPINRTDIFYPISNKNEISIEDQIIITLLHLFKHSNIYMKDINDLYYMLNQKIDLNYLKLKIDEYKLKEFLSIAIMYIAKEYPINKEKINEIVELFEIDTKILDKYPTWPYNNEMHLKIKKKDFEQRTQKKQEAERKYLFPAVIFVDKYNFKDIDVIEMESKGFELKKVLNNIYEVIFEDYTFYLTSIGIFIENYINTEKLSRRKCLNILENLLNIINKKDFYSVSYATEHFYVRIV